MYKNMYIKGVAYSIKSMLLDIYDFTLHIIIKDAALYAIKYNC